jgi:hypothetical protein
LGINEDFLIDALETVHIKQAVPTQAVPYGIQISVSEQMFHASFNWQARVRNGMIQRGEQNGMMLVGNVEFQRVPHLIHDDMLKLQRTYQVVGRFVPIPKTIN